MNIIFMGTPDFSVPVLNDLVQSHTVVAVYTQPPRPAGRGKKDRPTPVHARAVELGLPVRHPTSLKSPQALADLAGLNADIAVVVAYGLLLPQSVLDAPTHGCLNIHASLLPRWRGAAPIHRAVMAGDVETGVCIMQMEAGLDTGPVLLRAATPIGPTDTTGDLHDRLSQMGADLITQAIDTLPNLAAQIQPTIGVTYASKIDKAEARVNWNQPAETVARHINGLSPFPGAWCDVDGERLKLLRAASGPGQGTPGQVLGGFTIACATGAVTIQQAQRPGKSAMAADDILRGLTLPLVVG